MFEANNSEYGYRRTCAALARGGEWASSELGCGGSGAATGAEWTGVLTGLAWPAQTRSPQHRPRHRRRCDSVAGQGNAPARGTRRRAPRPAQLAAGRLRAAPAPRLPVACRSLPLGNVCRHTLSVRCPDGLMTSTAVAAPWRQSRRPCRTGQTRTSLAPITCLSYWTSPSQAGMPLPGPAVGIQHVQVGCHRVSAYERVHDPSRAAQAGLEGSVGDAGAEGGLGCGRGPARDGTVADPERGPRWGSWCPAWPGCLAMLDHVCRPRQRCDLSRPTPPVAAGSRAMAGLGS